MGYKKIGLDKPVYIFIMVFAILFSYTILTHYPPEAPYTLDQIINEPIYTYNDENITETNTDNGTIIEPLSVKARYTE